MIVTVTTSIEVGAAAFAGAVGATGESQAAVFVVRAWSSSMGRIRAQPAVDDSALFATVLRSVHGEHQGAGVRIDPAPMRVGPDFSSGAAHARFASDSAIIRRRTAFILASGFDTADVATFGFCAGVTAPQTAAFRAGCPSRGQDLTIMIGPPTAADPDRARPASLAMTGPFIIRIVEIVRAPGGSAITTYDEMYNRVAGTWTRTERRFVSVLE